MLLDDLGLLDEVIYVLIALHEVAGGTAGYTIEARVVLFIVDTVNSDFACGCWGVPAVHARLVDEGRVLIECDVNVQFASLCTR